MRNYDRVHPRKPEGIEERKAYIVGGGIAGLSAAAFLVRDAQMPGKNITVYDQLPVFGNSGRLPVWYITRSRACGRSPAIVLRINAVNRAGSGLRGTRPVQAAII